LHYGLETFESLKAYKSANGKILLFRPELNAERMTNSCQRLCLQPVPKEIFLESLTRLIRIDKDWVPASNNSVLYIRAFVFSSDLKIGISIPLKLQFVIAMAPVLCKSKLEESSPVKVLVVENGSRSSLGYTGNINCGGNIGS